MGGTNDRTILTTKEFVKTYPQNFKRILKNIDKFEIGVQYEYQLEPVIIIKVTYPSPPIKFDYDLDMTQFEHHLRGINLQWKEKKTSSNKTN